MTEFSLQKKTLEELCHVLAAFPEVEEAFLFGSHAKQNARRSSDIDLAIKAPQLSYDQYLTIRRRLNDVLLHEVDLVHLDRVKDPKFRKVIDETAKRFFKKKG
jgi:uncharacterized protein